MILKYSMETLYLVEHEFLQKPRKTEDGSRMTEAGAEGFIRVDFLITGIIPYIHN